MNFKVDELYGKALDYAVALSNQEEPKLHGKIWWTKKNLMLSDIVSNIVYAPSRIWAQAGPIIDREQINMFKHDYNDALWFAGIFRRDPGKTHRHQAEETGPSPLIAAMRCFVASKLGNTVEIPDELLPVTT